MDIQLWQAALLGFVQGVAEFLPISSSGHLTLVERAIGLQGIPLTFDVLTHAGTFAAVIVYFWKDIRSASLRLWLSIGIANIPIFALGYMLRPYMSVIKESRIGLASAFLITALFLVIADALLTEQKKNDSWFLQKMGRFSNWLQGLRWGEPQTMSLIMVGIFQTFAILPGVSRSGSTLLGGVVAGFERRDAFRFAFLIGLPAVAGAVVLDIFSTWQDGLWGTVDVPATLFATVIAGIVGFAALRLLEYVINRSHLRYFAMYCVFVSILSLLFV